MRKMNDEESKLIEIEITEIMRNAVSDEYSRSILEHEDDWTENTIMQDIINDVMETSAWEEEGYYNEYDIRLAIGRVLIDRLSMIQPLKEY